MALSRSFFGTISEISACQAGKLKAEAMPAAKASTNITQTVWVPEPINPPKAMARHIRITWAARMRRRLSCLSAQMPAANEKRKTGRLAAKLIMPSMTSEFVISRTSQLRATLCSQLPILESQAPTQNSRKSRWKRDEKVRAAEKRKRPATCWLSAMVSASAQ